MESGPEETLLPQQSTKCFNPLAPRMGYKTNQLCHPRRTFESSLSLDLHYSTLIPLLYL